MMDGAVTWNVFHILMHLISGQQPQRGKTRLTGHHPCYAIYETKDGKYVTVGALEEHFWKNLCTALDLTEFIPDEFAEGARREEMFRVIRAKFKTKTQKAWLDFLGPIDICFGPVSDIAEVFEDPQVRHRGLLPVVDGQRALGSPLKFSETPPRTPSLPPDFGQHTAEVLQQLGYGANEIDKLRAARVI